MFLMINKKPFIDQDFNFPEISVFKTNSIADIGKDSSQRNLHLARNGSVSSYAFICF